MNRIRRRLLKIFIILLPSSLTVPKIFAAQEYVVIDGWVMKRSDIESRQSMGRYHKCTPISTPD